MRDNRERWNTNARERRRVDEQFRLERLLRTKTMAAIARNQQTGSAIDDLGCSIKALKQYLAKQFKPRMSWNNWRRFWEIDHIRRLSLFDLTDRDQYLAACHYTNLQPLTIAVHRKKTALERAAHR
jgi:hypothetical protein